MIPALKRMHYDQRVCNVGSMASDNLAISILESYK